MTGMVRKIDELGRIVIPKEMRRVLKINPGSSVEIVAGEKENIVIKKFSEVNNLLQWAEELGREIYDITGEMTLVCDEDVVLFCQGGSKKEYLGKSFVLPDNFQDKNSKYIFGMKDGFEHTFICPLVVDSFECGYIFVLSSNALSRDKVTSITALCRFFTTCKESKNSSWFF